MRKSPRFFLGGSRAGNGEPERRQADLAAHEVFQDRICLNPALKLSEKMDDFRGFHCTGSDLPNSDPII
jgi:hypothetical protein